MKTLVIRYVQLQTSAEILKTFYASMNEYRNILNSLTKKISGLYINKVSSRTKSNIADLCKWIHIPLKHGMQICYFQMQRWFIANATLLFVEYAVSSAYVHCLRCCLAPIPTFAITLPALSVHI